MRASKEVDRKGQKDGTSTNAVESPEYIDLDERKLIDFLYSVEHVLECIVANPSLYDRNGQYYRDEGVKLKIWNEICSIFHEKCELFVVDLDLMLSARPSIILPSFSFASFGAFLVYFVGIITKNFSKQIYFQKYVKELSLKSYFPFQVQGSESESGDVGSTFEIKHTQKKIECLLQRLVK